MAEHPSASIVIYGARRATIIIMCASTSRMASHVRAAVWLLSVWWSGSAARIIARPARSLLGSEKSLGAAQRAAWEVGKSHFDSGRNFGRLLPLQGQGERYIAAIITGGMLIERLVVALEMDDGA